MALWWCSRSPTVARQRVAGRGLERVSNTGRAPAEPRSLRSQDSSFHALIAGRDVLPQIDSHALDAPGELVVERRVVVRDRGAEIDSHVQRLVEGDVVRNRLVHATGAVLAAIHEQHHVPTAADTPTVIPKLHANLVTP